MDIHAALVRAPDKGRQRRFGYAAADCIRECHLSNRSFQIRSDTDFVLHQYTTSSSALQRFFRNCIPSRFVHIG